MTLRSYVDKVKAQNIVSKVHWERPIGLNLVLVALKPTAKKGWRFALTNFRYFFSKLPMGLFLIYLYISDSFEVYFGPYGEPIIGHFQAFFRPYLGPFQPILALDSCPFWLKSSNSDNFWSAYLTLGLFLIYWKQCNSFHFSSIFDPL